MRLEKGGPNNPSLIANDFDSNATIISMCVAGVQFLIKYFEDRSAKAIEISALVKGWIFEWHMKDPAILGLAWHGISLANGALTRQTVESSQ